MLSSGEQEFRECIPPPIWKFSAPPNRKSMGQSGSLIIVCIQTMKWMKLKTERDLSYIDPLTVEFVQNNRTSRISVILLTNRRTDGQTNGHKFNTSLAEVIISPHFDSYILPGSSFFSNSHKMFYITFLCFKKFKVFILANCG